MIDDIIYDIIISDAALAMLDSHIAFLAKINQNTAMRLMDEILDSIESLSRNPLRYPAYESQFIPDNRYRKMLAAKRYLIFYEVTNSIVYIDYIIDCRQDYEWLIR